MSIQRKWNQNLEEITALSSSLHHYSTIAKMWKHLKSPSTDKWLKTTEDYLAMKRERICAICNNMLECGGCYILWNKSDWERSHLYVDSRRAKLIVIESRMVVAKGWVVKEWGDAGQRVRTSIYKMSKFYSSDVQPSDSS